MVATFGLNEGCQLPRWESVRLVEHNRRLSIWYLLEQGMLLDGAVSRVVFEGTRGGRRPTREVEIRRETPHVWLNGTRVLVSWSSPNPYVAHPFFECPVCARRTRFMYLRDRIACRKCFRLDWSVRHIGRQMPSAARVARLRLKLGCDDLRPFSPLPARRRGRSKAFHDALVRQIQSEEAKLVAHLGSIVYDLTRRQRVRREKKRRDATKASTQRPDPASS